MWPFWLLVPILYSSLYLVYPTGHCIRIYVLNPEGVESSNVILYEIFHLHPMRADGFSFPSIDGLPYPTFQFHHILLTSDVLLALLLVGELSRLRIFYRNCKGWSKHSSWSCWIPLVTWPEEISLKSRTTCEYCPDAMRITYLLASHLT